MEGNMDKPGKIIVTNLPKDNSLTDADLEKEFTAFGRITEIQLVKDMRKNVSRGFAFITFENPQDANDAIKVMEGKNLGGGKPIHCEQAIIGLKQRQKDADTSVATGGGRGRGRGGETRGRGEARGRGGESRGRGGERGSWQGSGMESRGRGRVMEMRGRGGDRGGWGADRGGMGSYRGGGEESFRGRGSWGPSMTGRGRGVPPGGRGMGRGVGGGYEEDFYRGGGGEEYYENQQDLGYDDYRSQLTRRPLLGEETMRGRGDNYNGPARKTLLPEPSMRGRAGGGVYNRSSLHDYDQGQEWSEGDYYPEEKGRYYEGRRGIDEYNGKDYYQQEEYRTDHYGETTSYGRGGPGRIRQPEAATRGRGGYGGGLGGERGIEGYRRPLIEEMSDGRGREGMEGSRRPLIEGGPSVRGREGLETSRRPLIEGGPSVRGMEGSRRPLMEGDPSVRGREGLEGSRRPLIEGGLSVRGREGMDGPRRPLMEGTGYDSYGQPEYDYEGEERGLMMRGRGGGPSAMSRGRGGAGRGMEEGRRPLMAGRGRGEWREEEEGFNFQREGRGGEHWSEEYGISGRGTTSQGRVPHDPSAYEIESVGRKSLLGADPYSREPSMRDPYESMAKRRGYEEEENGFGRRPPPVLRHPEERYREENLSVMRTEANGVPRRPLHGDADRYPEEGYRDGRGPIMGRREEFEEERIQPLMHRENERGDFDPYSRKRPVPVEADGFNDVVRYRQQYEDIMQRAGPMNGPSQIKRERPDRFYR